MESQIEWTDEDEAELVRLQTKKKTCEDDRRKRLKQLVTDLGLDLSGGFTENEDDVVTYLIPYANRFTEAFAPFVKP